MASRTSSSGAQPTTASMNHSSTANAASTTAASLAHMTDRAAQEFGLSGQALQMLHVFAVQCTPKLDALWTYASILRCMSLSQTAIDKVGEFETKLNEIKAYVQEEYHLTKSQEIMLKKLMRRLACTSKTSFLTVPDRTKVFVTKNGSTFGLDLYTLNDEHVKLATDQFIDSYGHQVRGTFRKAIFSEVEDGRTLELASHRICTLMSAEVGNPPPKFVQARIAQLRLIAHKVMADIKKKEQAAAAQAGPSANRGTKTKKPRNDTGFWQAVDKKFERLVAAYKSDWNHSADWANWEDSVIAADNELFVGVAQLTDSDLVPFNLDED